jgi:hypothetical protein
MAITIVSSPSLYQPVYNPFYWNITSSNSSQPNFRFVVDIFTGSTASTYVSRLRILPRPGGSANCIVSPARVLESFISYDINAYSAIGGIPTSNEILNYTLSFGEEYGATATGTTTYPNLKQSSGLTWNAVVPYTILSPSVFKYTDYVLSAATSNFLTNQPNNVYFRNPTDRASLTFTNNDLSATISNTQYVEIFVYQKSGGSIFYQIGNNAFSSTTAPQNIINHFGVGPWNINNVPPAMFVTPFVTSTLFNFNTDLYYTVQCWYNELTPVSKLQTYTLDTCTKYQTVRLQWLNELGGWDYFNFNLISRKSITTNRSTFKKPLAYNYVIGDRGTTVIDMNSQESVLVNANYVNDATSIWLSTSLMNSTEVYEQLPDGTILPVIIDDNDKEELKQINDGLLKYEFNYTYANPVNTKRN